MPVQLALGRSSHGRARGRNRSRSHEIGPLARTMARCPGKLQKCLSGAALPMAPGHGDMCRLSSSGAVRRAVFYLLLICC